MAKQFDDEKFFRALENGNYGNYLCDPKTPEERAQIVGQQLQRYRKRDNLSQNALCRLLGCAKQTYSGYENGRHEPQMETLVRLSYLYDVSLDSLMGKYRSDDVDLGDTKGDENSYMHYLEQEDEKRAFGNNKRLHELEQEIKNLSRKFELFTRKKDKE